MRFNKSSLSILCLLSFGFYGCSTKTQDNPQAKLIPTEQTPVATQLAYASGGFKNEWPAENWWQIFQDAQLSNLIETVIQNNPTIQMAISKLDSAQASARKDKSKLLPHLFFAADDNWEHFSKNSIYSLFPGFPASLNQIDFMFNLTYDFDLFGKNRKLYESSLGVAKASAAESYYTKLLISTACAKAYFALQCDLLRLELLQALKDTRIHLIELTKARKTHALDDDLQLTGSSEPLKDMEVLIELSKNQIILDKHVIAALLGKGPDSELNLAKQPLPIEEPIFLPEEISLNLLSRRADLMAELWRVESAAKQVGAAKASFYPNLNLAAYGGLDSISWTDLVNWQSKQFGLIPAFSFPIYTGGELRANLTEKHKVFETAIFSYNEKLLAALKETADAITNLMSSRYNLTQKEEKTALSQKLENLTKSRLQAGLDTELDLCQITEATLYTKLDALQQKQTLLLNSVKLIESLGGGYYAEKKPSIRGQNVPQ